MRQQITIRGFPHFCLLTLPAIVFAITAHGQPVTLDIGVSNGQVRLSWPDGLSVVQPQKSTNASIAKKWIPVGSPTVATSVSEPINNGGSYYRLRFFGPTISTYPKGSTNVVGGEVLLTVAAFGTTPITYQWRKGGVPLPGENSPTLLLNDLAIEQTGNYDVRVSNRVGGVGTPPVLVGVTNPPARRAGIYTGNLTGQTDNGGFAVMVRSDESALAVGDNTPLEKGVSTTLGTFTVTRAVTPKPSEF
jgi:hypothetical protein